MTGLRIRHTTSYQYKGPVALNPHRLMLRPRDGRDLTIRSMDLSLDPPADLTWSQDVFGNAVVTASFRAPAAALTIGSTVEIELRAAAWPVFDIAAAAIAFPFQYDDDAWADLGALSAPQHADPEGRLGAWARSFVRQVPADTLSLLKDINAHIPAAMTYKSRDAEGTQAPARTLVRRMGSCRDFAVLFAEAVRALGFGTRIVSGYLHDPERAMAGSGCSTTHAWAEVYLPGAGWVAFDPTNGRVGGANLIPVAVGRDIRHVMPVTGSFAGSADALEGTSVDVSVTASTDG